jgi:polysaccharide biosynthesis/export protein
MSSNLPPRQHLASFFLTLALAAVPLLPGHAAGQATPSTTTTPTTTSEDPASQGLQRRPLGIEETQPDAHEEYLLGAGDDIIVTVAGRPELSGPQVVGPDGRITLPVIGSVLIGEKSRDDASKAIDDAVEKYYSGGVSSTVQVTKYGSNHILVLGAVEHPGVMNFDQPPSLLEAITRGGSLVNADHTIQVPRKCVIYRGDDKVMNVNISDRFDSKRALLDIRLRRNDILYFPENQESLVSVIGEVKAAGPERLISSTTLITLLAGAGGITEKAGNNPMIEIVEPSTGKIQKVQYKQLLTVNGASDISLHDGDIVFVPRSGLTKVGYAFQQVAPIIGLATIFTLFAQ